MSSSVAGDMRTPTAEPSRQSSQMPIAESPAPALDQTELTRSVPPVDGPQQSISGESSGSGIAPLSLRSQSPGLQLTLATEISQRQMSTATATTRSRESSSDLSELSETGGPQVPPVSEPSPATQTLSTPQAPQIKQTPEAPQVPLVPQVPQAPQVPQVPQILEAPQPVPSTSALTSVHVSNGIHHDEEGEPIHYEAGTLVWARQGKYAAASRLLCT